LQYTTLSVIVLSFSLVLTHSGEVNVSHVTL